MIFMRPWFLLLLIAIPFFFHLRKKSLTNNPWKKIIKPEFLHLLMVKTGQTKKSKSSIILISLLWTILSIALAGPAFEKAPTKADKNDQGTVLIVDLNSLNKTTLNQVKIKLSEVIKHLKGERIGLVLYDEKGYIALPMTEDKKIVEELIPVLDPSVLPAVGNKPEEGFKTAIELLQNNNLDTGRILFFTGGVPSSKNTLSVLETKPYSVGILGFGDGEKTPILSPNGQFKRDANGNIVLTNLNKEELQKIGTLELWHPDDSDIISLLEKTNSFNKPSLFNNAENKLLTVDTYKDLGVYLLLFSMPFLALFYRKGFFVFIILICSFNANASLWLRDDQILYNTNEKAVTAYKNKDYLSALAGFKNDSSETGLYNQANATAHMKRYQEAIDLYKQVLEKNPNHKEARFNKAYLEQMMKNNNSSSQDKSQKDNQNQEKNESSSNQNNNQSSNTQDQNSDQKESDNESKTNNEQKQSDNSSNQNTDSESKENNLEQNAANASNNLDEKNKDSSNEQQQEQSDKNENDQIYPPKKEQTQSDQKEKEEQSSPSTQNNNQQGQITEETENENPIDQTSQEIFNRLKKDPSRLLRYRLYEQNRRKP